jgi:hypothetical protein
MAVHHPSTRALFRFRCATLAVACAAAAASAQRAGNIGGRLVNLNFDSGVVEEPQGGGGGGEGAASAVTGPPRRVWQAEAGVAGAKWVRLVLTGTTLPPGLSRDQQPFLRIVSLQDGAVQTLGPEALAEWSGTSAYFNGPAVRVELWSPAGLAGSRAVVAGVVASDPMEAAADLCTDDDRRQPSNDLRVARLLSPPLDFPLICTTWVIADTNHGFLSAGHCRPTAGAVVQFNVPPSDDLGGIVFPPPEDQYAVDAASVQRATIGEGNDWAYFGVAPNSNTGLLPFQVYGEAHTLAQTVPDADGRTLRVTGHGSTFFPAPMVNNYTQQTHAGPYLSRGVNVRYAVDTTSGNSGSPVLDTTTNLVIGIHVLAGCNPGSGGVGNQATPITNANLQIALSNPLSVLRSGVGTVFGPLYAIGDANNNFGTVNGPPQRFAKVAQVGAGWQGLAWDYNRSLFYACDAQRRLLTLTPTGDATLIGTISGTSAVVAALGFDPKDQVLYGFAPTTGQLLRIDTTTAAATPIGPVRAGNIAALDYDTSRRILFAVEDHPFGSRLVRINVADGARTIVGLLGDNTSDCNGLAFNAADGFLYTINSVNDFLYRVDPGTGAATRVGFTFGSFGAAFGMAAMNPAPCRADFNGDGRTDPDDLADFIVAFFTAPPGPGADADGNGTVDGDDLSEFVGVFFTPCP